MHANEWNQRCWEKVLPRQQINFEIWWRLKMFVYEKCTPSVHSNACKVSVGRVKEGVLGVIHPQNCIFTTARYAIYCILLHCLCTGRFRFIVCLITTPDMEYYHILSDYYPRHDVLPYSDWCITVFCLIATLHMEYYRILTDSLPYSVWLLPQTWSITVFCLIVTPDMEHYHILSDCYPRYGVLPYSVWLLPQTWCITVLCLIPTTDMVYYHILSDCYPRHGTLPYSVWLLPQTWNITVLCLIATPDMEYLQVTCWY